MAEPIQPPPPDLATASLADIAQAVADKRLPPVEKWNPERCGDSDMRIARDGTWFYQGSPIGRAAMVRLFSTVLRREGDGDYVLVTPVEKLDILVEDAPFVAVELKSEGEGPARRLAFRLNTDEVVVAGPDHPLRFSESTAPENTDGPRPYLHVRGAIGKGLEALIARPLYYELAEMALSDGEEPLSVWSDGARFPLVPSA